MLDWDKYRDVKHDDLDYNCLHFVCDVYQDLTGIDLSPDVLELRAPLMHRRVCPDKLSYFILRAAPIDSYIAVMRNPNNVHCGIFLNGHIVHLDKDGIKSQPPHIAQRQYQTVKYYDYKPKKQYPASTIS